jgi:hypothetical protein
MRVLTRFTALAVTMTAALFISQPSQAITPVVQPHLMFAHGFSPDSLVTTVARRGGYGGGTVYRGRGVHRGGVYRGRGVYRGGVYRGGVYRGGVYRRTGIGYGAMCGYAPYPPCAGGYYGGVYRGGVYRGGVYRGGVYRGGVAYRRGGVYRGGVHRGGAHRVYRGGRRR